MNVLKYLAIAIPVMAVCAVSCKKEVDYSIAIKTDAVEQSMVITPSTPVIVKYTVESPSGVEEVTVKTSDNITVTHLPSADKMSGQVVLVLSSKANDSYCEITARNAQKSASYRLGLEMETVVADGPVAIDITAAGGDVKLKVRANVDYDVAIPEDAASWLSLVKTKTISPYEIVLHAAANNDVRRSTSVTVSSHTAAEIKVKFDLEQAGVLNNLKLTYVKDKVKSPNLLGEGASGTIFWGDGYTLQWELDAMHTYVDGRRAHNAEIHTKSSSCEFTTLDGIEKIDMTEF